MVISDILKYISPEEALNNDTIGLCVDVNPERHNNDFTTKFISYFGAKIYNDISTRSES